MWNILADTSALSNNYQNNTSIVRLHLVKYKETWHLLDSRNFAQANVVKGLPEVFVL
jgi:hypothetical protein